MQNRIITTICLITDPAIWRPEASSQTTCHQSRVPAENAAETSGRWTSQKGEIAVLQTNLCTLHNLIGCYQHGMIDATQFIQLNSFGDFTLLFMIH